MKRGRGTRDGQAGHSEMWKKTVQWRLDLTAPQVLSNMHSHHRPGMDEFLMEAGEGVIIAVSDSTQSPN